MGRALAVEVAMGNPGDSSLGAVYAVINDDWTPADFLCVIDAQVAEVQQIGATVTGRGESRQVTISPDHAGSQVQDGGGEADCLGSVIHPPTL